MRMNQSRADARSQHVSRVCIAFAEQLGCFIAYVRTCKNHSDRTADAMESRQIEKTHKNRNLLVGRDG